MLIRRHANAALASTMILASTSGLTAQMAKTQKLPPPRASGGKPLIDALKLRRSIGFPPRVSYGKAVQRQH